ncbi:tegument protein pp71 [Panine betaherpesvirus 2]|uniref:Tegument protein pp71 n=1 Tax=Panine betaherpesvirus 2 TaxID=188763 RepID=Q8QS17_9BETA|nr:tegument protein pp71 [Panine betaherpesvirus 2]AAM00721.1 tegument protein pp71 [Panine betaherpesvirus 2]QXV67831.1 tegument protein pp71 [Panine betaherpesvirus 2]
MSRSPSPGEGPSAAGGPGGAPGDNGSTFGRMHCQVLRLVTNHDSSLEPDRLKILDLRTSVEVSRTSVLCLFQENKSQHDTVDLTDLNVKGHCAVGERDQLKADLINYSQRRMSPGSSTPISVLAFGLPLERVPVSGIHLFQAHPRGDEENRLRTEARVDIRRTAYHWGVRTTVSPRWRRKVDRSLEAEQIFTTEFIFRAGAIPLRLVDAVELLSCSDRNTYIHKAETDARGQWVNVHLQHETLHPPPSVFLHFSLYTHGAEVVLRHNPYPHLTRHGDNGFTLHAPRGFTLSRLHREYIVQVQNAFETNNTHDVIFFPADIPGVSMEAGPLPDRVRITIRLTWTGENSVRIEHMQILGTIHLFKRGVLNLLPGKTEKIKRPQIQLRAGLFPRRAVMRGEVSEFRPQSPGELPLEGEEEEEEEEERSSTPTPPALSESVFAAFEESSEEEESDTEEGLSRALALTGRRRPRRGADEGEDLMLVIPSWNVFVNIDNLVPLTGSVEQAALKPTSYLRSEMQGDVRTAADFTSNLQPVPVPRPSPMSLPSTSGTAASRSRPRI